MLSKPQHTPGALRAAAIIHYEYMGYGNYLQKFATLIDRETAAPELLAACKAALSYLPTKDGELLSPMPSDPDEKVQLNIANQLKAAIAKAKDTPCDTPAE